MVNGQRWPGSRVVHTGYGVPGAVSIDRNGDIIVARQHEIGGVVNGGTRQLYPPLNPSRADFVTSVVQLGQTEYASNFLASHAFGGVPLDLTRSLGFESHALLSPSLVDLHFGTRINTFRDQIMYADQSFIKFFSPESHMDAPGDVSDNYSSDKRRGRRHPAEFVNFDDELFLDMRSPVLQIDSNGIVRTRKGLAYAGSVEEATYFQDGDFMHAVSFPGGKAAATSPLGEVRLIDIETGTVISSCVRSRGSLSGWSRVVPLGEQQALWANRYTMARLDFRQPGNTGTPSNGKDNIVLDFPDRQREIKDVGINSNGDVFALTSYQIIWICGEPQVMDGSDSTNMDLPYSPALTVDHPIAKDDWSTNMCVSHTNSRTLITVTSQLSPLVTAAFFDRSKDSLPMLMDDLYYLESWPTIVPQSHMTLETRQGFDIYSVGNDGGLFRQHWIETGATSSKDDLLDLPPVDSSEPSTAAPPIAEKITNTSDSDNDSGQDPYKFALDGVEYRPFELMRPKETTEVLDMSSVYKTLFQTSTGAIYGVDKNDYDSDNGNANQNANQNDNDNSDIEEVLSTNVSEKFTQLGVCSSAELVEMLERQYLDGARSRLSKQGIASVERQIKNMATAVAKAVTNTQPVIYRTDSELGLGREEMKILSLWPVDTGDDTEIMSSQPSVFSQSSSQADSHSQLSQPLTQAVPAMSQPSLTQPSLSQPMLSQPTLGLSRKRKHKKRKHR